MSRASTPRVPPSLAALATLATCLAGCAGGQTGEITMMDVCHEPIGTAEVGDASDAGRSAEAQLAALVTSATGQLQRAPGREGLVGIEAMVELTGEPATLLGGAECTRPRLSVPVLIMLRSADGALDETLSGTMMLSDSDLASVQATIELAEVRGSLDPSELGVERGSLFVALVAEPSALRGEVQLHSEMSGDAPRRLATF